MPLWLGAFSGFALAPLFPALHLKGSRGAGNVIFLRGLFARKGVKMLEQRHERLLPVRAFILRVILYAVIAVGLIILSLVVGVLGYRHFEGMSWIDSFLNASMLMGGMGPVSRLETDAGKMFAGIYALYCGMILLASVAILMTPVAHRLLHKIHMEARDFR